MDGPGRMLVWGNKNKEQFGGEGFCRLVRTTLSLLVGVRRAVYFQSSRLRGRRGTAGNGGGNACKTIFSFQLALFDRRIDYLEQNRLSTSSYFLKNTRQNWGYPQREIVARPAMIRTSGMNYMVANCFEYDGSPFLRLENRQRQVCRRPTRPTVSPVWLLTLYPARTVPAHLYAAYGFSLQEPRFKFWTAAVDDSNWVII
ncbi:hypothetical protein BD779DRAFT_1474518 [Infundibulicybe gibba]|nr:hypothetical protein BD779DRAFT_1474518 [Infundibulicybe gibba]